MFQRLSFTRAGPGRAAGRHAVPVIVLARVLTGLATVRSLGQAGVDVHVIYFDAHDPVRLSRYVRQAIYFDETVLQPKDLIPWVERLARQIGNRPVVLPVSDRDALLLAEHRERLLPWARLWTTSYPHLLEIVRKNRLYPYARTLGIPLISDCTGPTLEAYAVWAADNQGPYIVKPSPGGQASIVFDRNGTVVHDASSLLRLIAERGPTNVVVQRVVAGGDGFIFDTYGLTNADGHVVTMASHRRLRQLPPGFGATCHGEVPAVGVEGLEARLFSHTERLLAGTRFHGIFGIEWLMDRASQELYLIDFNARPFLSIGHLTDCGMNLPYLAYLDLIGTLPELERTPKLRYRRWVDLLRDLEAYVCTPRSERELLVSRLLGLLRCRSFAYLNWRDPKPAVQRGGEFLTRLFRFARKAL